MLSFLFGFDARLGRMHYFLATIALAVVMTAICFVIATYVFQHTPKGMLSTANLLTWPVIAAIVFFGWMTFTLQSMRIRDIGWDPVCIIPGWIALLIVDKLVASKIPAWSFDHDRNGTIVGALVNFGLILALTFWPSGDYESPSPTFTETRRKPDQPSSRSRASSVSEERIARATGEFGRRAF
jgi:uncharacterized membrane protein YhaH (DUF805 family)